LVSLPLISTSIKKIKDLRRYNMAKKSPKPRPMKSRKNGLKHRDRINKNHEILKKYEKFSK
jgi:hypothetical protein